MVPKSILVFIPNWVGDVVMATPALRAIRRQYPAARIVHLIRSYVADVLEGTEFADDVVFWPGGRKARRSNLPDRTAPSSHIELIRRLRRGRFDLAVLLTNSFRSALVARLAGASRRAGYARDGRGWLLTDRLEPPRENGCFVPIPALDYYNNLVRRLGCHDVTDRLELATTAADEDAIDRRLGLAEPARPLIVLNPGAHYGPAKCWPAEYYAELADALVDRYDARVVASLAAGEGPIADRLAAAVKRPLEIFVDPPLGLGPLKALVRRCRLLITNDTGPRHFAAALGVPVVTIFGSSDPAWTDTRYARERIVTVHLDCQPCMKRVCPLVHHNCMRQLLPERVLEKVEELLPRPAPVAGRRG
jgi:heptosyltransferase-2